MKKHNAWWRLGAMAAGTLLVAGTLTGCANWFDGSDGGGGGASGGGGGTVTALASGTVTDTGDDPVADARVVLVSAADVQAINSIQPMEDVANAVIANADSSGTSTKAGATGYFTTTAADGTYSIPEGAVADGSYYEVVIPAAGDTGHLPSTPSREAITVASGKVVVTSAVDGDADAGSAGDIEISATPSASATFIGSIACLSCHNGGAASDKTGLKHTLHFVGFRVPGQTNNLQDTSSFTTVDGGVGQFTGQCIEFGAKGNTHWAWIDKDATGYFLQMGDDASCTIKSAKYYMAFTYGGEGLYKQRFMMLVGADGGPATKHVQDDATTGGYYYPAPFQWNESNATTSFPAAFGENGEFSGKWIPPTADGDLVFAPESTDATTGTPMGAPTESFGVDCGGCHGGVAITKDASGNFITQFIDQIDPAIYAGNIGCERCHGPGSEHQAAGGQGKAIVHPDLLTPGRLNMVCGTCHQRGHGGSVLDASGAHAGFASKGDLTADPSINIFRAGMSPAQMYGTSQAAPDFGTNTDYWQAITFNETGNPGHVWNDMQYGAAFNHSESHHQQYYDEVRGTMFKNDIQTVTCIDCHDAHGGTGLTHQVTYNADNNAMCLECHNASKASAGGFDTITRAMVDTLEAGGTADPAIGTAVEGHMTTFAGMTASYDPTGTKVGRCIACHMPKTAKTARWNETQTNGYREGDIRSHTFDVMSKEALQTMFTAVGGVKTEVTPAAFTNKCGAGCHDSALPK